MTLGIFDHRLTNEFSGTLPALSSQSLELSIRLCVEIDGRFLKIGHMVPYMATQTVSNPAGPSTTDYQVLEEFLER